MPTLKDDALEIWNKFIANVKTTMNRDNLKPDTCRFPDWESLHELMALIGQVYDKEIAIRTEIQQGSETPSSLNKHKILVTMLEGITKEIEKFNNTQVPPNLEDAEKVQVAALCSFLKNIRTYIPNECPSALKVKRDMVKINMNKVRAPGAFAGSLIIAWPLVGFTFGLFAAAAATIGIHQYCTGKYHFNDPRPDSQRIVEDASAKLLVLASQIERREAQLQPRMSA